MPYTVKQLADLAGITIRTLHHYDKIGLLSPSSHTKKGYRLYEEKDLIKLQQILFFKELEFSLNEIKRMMNTDEFNIMQSLKDQKHLMQLKKNRMEKLLQSIDTTINSMKKKQKLSPQELYDPFNDDNVKQYQQEVKERWEKTDAYKQSMQRVKRMTKEQMEKIKADQRQNEQMIASLMDKGPENQAVQEQIQIHYNGINQFYDCSLEMYQNLADMYVSDPRFTAHYNETKAGLAKFMQSAITFYIKNRR
jgi:DNA-binding transcriptional MerR regulator